MNLINNLKRQQTSSIYLDHKNIFEMGEIYPCQITKWVDLHTFVNRQIKMAAAWLPFKIYELLICIALIVNETRCVAQLKRQRKPPWTNQNAAARPDRPLHQTPETIDKQLLDR